MQHVIKYYKKGAEMMNISKEALTTRETALVLNISTNKVYELIEKEKLLAYKDED